ncbi:hypothetical protein [Noviherbaspirillum sedimenti]|uniref:hypothetical protein n=1 Tax=Noviherbaspirillum sedimenti TaxID=2320865 RepID=UPI0013140CA7|nr:hypothetical protein [Noviherbaspirillum sedimenti]
MPPSVGGCLAPKYALRWLKRRDPHFQTKILSDIRSCRQSKRSKTAHSGAQHLAELSIFDAKLRELREI